MSRFVFQVSFVLRCRNAYFLDLCEVCSFRALSFEEDNGIQATSFVRTIDEEEARRYRIRRGKPDEVMSEMGSFKSSSYWERRLAPTAVLGVFQTMSRAHPRCFMLFLATIALLEPTKREKFGRPVCLSLD